jgi:hypothetical protein
MSHDHTRTLEHIFAHPINMNMKWNEVEHMFRALGASLESTHGGREKIKLGGQEMTFHVPHGKTISSKEEVMQLRHFLERCGIVPESK